MTMPEALFSELLAAQPSRPFVTYYDESTGERAELSARSLANWVAKTHHLLGDELGLGVGDLALIALPAHWISVPAVLGCLTAGLALTADDIAADVAFAAPATLASCAGVPDIYAIATESPAAGFREAVPAGANDYVAAVRPQGDVWSGVQFPASAADPCLGGLTRAEVVSAASQRAGELGLSAGTRAICTRDWTGPADWMDTLLAPLAVGGSVVYVRNCPDHATLARRAAQEQATVTIR